MGKPDRIELENAACICKKLADCLKEKEPYATDAIETLEETAFTLLCQAEKNENENP